MKKSICTITTLILLLALCFSTLAESKYVSIDTPIVVPEVDIVPIVRITWNGPAESLDESLEIIRST